MEKGKKSTERDKSGSRSQKAPSKVYTFRGDGELRHTKGICLVRKGVGGQDLRNRGEQGW